MSKKGWRGGEEGRKEKEGRTHNNAVLHATEPLPHTLLLGLLRLLVTLLISALILKRLLPSPLLGLLSQALSVFTLGIVDGRSAQALLADLVVLLVPLLRLIRQGNVVPVLSVEHGLGVVLGVHTKGALGDPRDANALGEDGGLVGSDGASAFGDELVLRGGFVDLVELVLGRGDLAGGLGGADGEEVAADEGEVGEEFADFGIGEDEGEEGAEVLDG